MANAPQLGTPAKVGAAAGVVAVVVAAAYFMGAAPAPMPVPDPAAPVSAPTPAPDAAQFAPTLDVVRVEPDGSATVAGQAAPLAHVSLRVDGVEIAAVDADGAGAYASLFTLPAAATARILTVGATGADGVLVMGRDQVILAPTQTTVALADAPADAPPAAPPAALKIGDNGVQVLQPANPDAPIITDNISIDSITYLGGLVQVGGRGTPAQSVRLYVDNTESGSGTIAANGAWSADLSNIEPGVYTLRADQLDADGKVTSRYETPFKREAPEQLAAAPAETAAGAATVAADTAAQPAAPPVSITVQPGLTLWAIAEQTFGAGTMYVQVYEANKDQIRDPDLIYPGQVFAIPKAP